MLDATFDSYDGGTAKRAELDTLRRHVREVDDLTAAAASLHWDRNTFMPPGGAEARGRHLATLLRLAHDRLVDPAVRASVDRLRADPHDLDACDRDMVRVVADCRASSRRSSARLGIRPTR